MNELALSPFWIPLGGMVMVCAIVFIRSRSRLNQREMESRHGLQIREMEHQQKMKELELELAKLEAAKTNTGVQKSNS